MENPLKPYFENPSAPKEGQKVTDERAREKALEEQEKAIDKNIVAGNDAAAKRIIEARKRVKNYQF